MDSPAGEVAFRRRPSFVPDQPFPTSTPASAGGLVERRASLTPVVSAPSSTLTSKDSNVGRGSAVAIPFSPTPTSSSTFSSAAPFDTGGTFTVPTDGDYDVLVAWPTDTDDSNDPLLQVRSPSFITTAFDSISTRKHPVAHLPLPLRRLLILVTGTISTLVLLAAVSPVPLPRILPSLHLSSTSFSRRLSLYTTTSSAYGSNSGKPHDVHDLESLLDAISAHRVVGAVAGRRAAHAQPLGESRHLLKRMPSFSNDGEVVLSEEEKGDVKKVREELLWAGGETDLETFTYESNSSLPHLSTVIFLHGLAQIASEDAIIPSQLRWVFPNVKWVMPQAPQRNVSLFTVGTGTTLVKSGWFDQHTLPYDASTDHDDEAIFISARQLNAVLIKERALLIQAAHGDTSTVLTTTAEYDAYGTEEEKKWASKRIVLSGFSQGGAMSLLVGLTHKYELGGLALLSTVLPVRQYMNMLTHDLSRTALPIYWGHGTSDPILSYSDALSCLCLLSPSSSSLPAAIALGERTSSASGAVLHPPEALQLGLTDVTLEGKDGVGHYSTGGELVEIKEFLERVLPDAVV